MGVQLSLPSGIPILGIISFTGFLCKPFWVWDGSTTSRDLVGTYLSLLPLLGDKSVVDMVSSVGVRITED